MPSSAEVALRCAEASVDSDLLAADESFLARTLSRATPAALLMSLVQISGDAGLLERFAPTAAAAPGQGAWSPTPTQREALVGEGLRILGELRARGGSLPALPDRATLQRMLSHAVGERVPAEYAPMMLEEMALDGRDARVGLGAQPLPAQRLSAFRVAVIGAGMSGLLAAIRLRAAGIDCVVLEKNDGVGGTWRENRYPGCRVDVGNHFYCYSFAPNPGWSEHFSRQPELLRYFEGCARDFDIERHIRFGCEVETLRWDEAAAQWELQLRGAGGARETLRADAVISAVGQLNRPKLPEIEGRERFRGPAFHSARWPADFRAEGMRIAVIGSAASAFQLVPELAECARGVVVFQRTPNWMLPNPRYRKAVGPETQWLLAHLPYYARWIRFLIFWPGSDGLLPALIRDPAWPHPERSLNARNEATRVALTAYLEAQCGDDRALLAKITPAYPPFAKRILQDDGRWIAALRRPNVELVTEPIACIDEGAVVASGGARYEVDAIVYATGFEASRFLAPLRVFGRGGVELAQAWGDEPRALYGITTPGFPNLFFLYGPGTNLAHAGSIIFHSECQVRYAMGCLDLLLRSGKRALECRRSASDAYAERYEQAVAQTVWAQPQVSSWYKNARGKVTTTSPWRLLDYWSWTRQPDAADFEIH